MTINNVRKSFYGKTKSEVKNKAKEYLNKIENGYKEPKKIVLNDYIEYWLKNYKLNKIEPTSYSRLYSVYIHQIKDTIGKNKIGDITTKDIQELIDNRANPISKDIKPLAMSGLKKILQLLRPCFNTAIQEEILYKNPCDNVILPKESCIQTETKKQFSLSDEEIERFKKAALSKYKTTHEYCSRDGFILLFMMNLGLRVGEVLALEWDDFDFNNKIVYINKTVQSNVMNFETGKSGTLIKKSTKTNAGIRILNLNDNVVEYLEELRKYNNRNNISSKYLCCTRVGTINSARNLQRSLDRILMKAQINKKVTLHTLRHTFGSVLLRKGVNIEVVSKLMGHANINITYNKYIHSIKEEEAKAMTMIKVC
ncbi:hypothetical protein ASU35_17465 [Acetivibrio ethanolgignens]|uniref:Tyr recombinase domain-containing protein n=1 Tax=Acetivibrio ethanolgignens TaxID=290052 RepID=A0A0V8QI45_9FIRM|nr:hypothetical protein ASU35_17465 [Acetivibrio ethanolgignens]